MKLKILKNKLQVNHKDPKIPSNLNNQKEKNNNNLNNSK